MVEYGLNSQKHVYPILMKLRKEAETNSKVTKGLVLLTKETFSLKVLNAFFMNLQVL
jgi:hypothetical protein